MALTRRTAVLETIRSVGTYAIVDDAIYFLPHDLLDDLVEQSLHRRDGSSTTYTTVRAATHLACALAPTVLDVSAPTEAMLPLPQRLVRFVTIADATRHRDDLADFYDALGSVKTFPREGRTALSGGARSLDERAAFPPKASFLGPSLKSVVVMGRSLLELRQRAAHGPAAIETLSAVGTYLYAHGSTYFVPTRVVGDAGGDVFGLVARLPAVHKAQSAEAGIAFSRRIARFENDEEAVSHRTRLAAMLLVPPSPLLSRPAEVPLHYGERADCDRPWLAAHLQESATADSPPRTLS